MAAAMPWAQLQGSQLSPPIMAPGKGELTPGLGPEVSG